VTDGCSFEAPPALDDGGTGDDDGTGEQFALTVATTGDGGGRITATVDGAAVGIDCGSDCTETLPAGRLELASAGQRRMFLASSASAWRRSAERQDQFITLPIAAYSSAAARWRWRAVIAPPSSAARKAARRAALRM